MRAATKEDFKIGTVLITSEGHKFTIYAKYDTGIWEARGPWGCKRVFEIELITVRTYSKMKDQTTQATYKQITGGHVKIVKIDGKIFVQL